MTGRQRALLRMAGGAALLAVVLWRLGTGPLLAGLGRINLGSLAAAAAIGVVTTICCACRWSLVARGLGVGVAFRPAVAAYYRSQFLNSTLPGGVLGDLDRAVSHGREVGDVGRGLRAVVWERTAGQVVQAVLTILVLLLLPSPVRFIMPVLVGVLVMSVIAGILLLRRAPRTRVWVRSGQSRSARLFRTASVDIREALFARELWPGIVVSSTVVVAGHVATFLIAARTAGSPASVGRLLPIAALVLLAMAIPANIGGWGPREGMAAWAFGAAGLGASVGLAASVVYGVMALVAALPGAVVLGLTLAKQRRRAPRPAMRAVVLSAPGSAGHG